MVKFKKLFSLFLMFFVMSCFPLTNHGLKKLRVNDSKQMVIKIMGKPFSSRIHYNKEILVYYIHDDFFDLLFVGKFPFVGIYPLLRTGDEHWVILENGHLVAQGEEKGMTIDKDGKITLK